MKQHLIFVGLPGSGKSTVGRSVAERVGATFADLDKVVERQQGMPIERIFAELGEVAFRRMESEAMGSLLEGDPCVLAPGGGWAAQPGEMDRAKEHGLVVYLKTMITTAVDRTKMHDYRPLLMSDDRYERMRELLKEREPFYIMAHAEIDNASRPIEDVIEEAVVLAHAQAGW
ncbi:MAG: shikimate kinase [Gemmatimonadetes bacterium]|nr:shikimate kinase [Gemmatimonadota bacterium]